MSAEKHIAQKCTFCYDRLQNGLVPAVRRPARRDRSSSARSPSSSSEPTSGVAQLHGQGARRLTFTGRTSKILGGLNAFYLLMDPPETYGLPTEVQVQGPESIGVAGFIQGSGRVAGDRPGLVRVVQPPPRRGGRQGKTREGPG